MAIYFLSTHKATDYNGLGTRSPQGARSEAAYGMSVVEIRKLVFKRDGVICPGEPGLVPVCLCEVTAFSELWTQ